MKRVLVTGASGFIGRQCLSLLQAAGYEVHAVSSDVRPRDEVCRWHHADLLQTLAASRLLETVRPTHLLHLAWFAVPGLYWTAAENQVWVRASLELLEAFTSCGGQRVVAAGTCAEYDWDYGWCSESVTPLAPSSPYGQCKNALRSLIEARHVQAGLSWSWGRIFFLYGPYEHPSRLVASVIRALLRGEPANCTRGEQIRDFLHVADVASAFVALLNSEVQGAVNIGSGQPVAVREIVGLIGRQMGKGKLINFGARESSPGDPPMLVADTRRLSSEVHWRPHFDLASGLDATIDWWRRVESAG